MPLWADLGDVEISGNVGFLPKAASKSLGFLGLVFVDLRIEVVLGTFGDDLRH